MSEYALSVFYMLDAGLLFYSLFLTTFMNYKEIRGARVCLLIGAQLLVKQTKIIFFFFIF